MPDMSKLPVQGILERFIERVRETGEFSERALTRLEELTQVGQLTSLEDLKKCLSTSTEDGE